MCRPALNLTLAPSSMTLSPVTEVRFARSGDVHVAYRVVGEGPIDLVYAQGAFTHLEIYWGAAGIPPLLRAACGVHAAHPLRQAWHGDVRSGPGGDNARRADGRRSRRHGRCRQ